MTVIRSTGFALACLLTGCNLSSPDSASREDVPPPRAGQPLDPVEMATRIAKIRADAVMGNRDGVRRDADAMQDDLRRSMKLPDARRPVDREAARVAAKSVQGVHSVVWVDRSNLLALVDNNEQRTMGTIDAICRELDPLGDTLAVVVHLQSRVARTGDELETLSRNCQLAEGDRALLQERRQLDVLSPEIRAEHAAQQRGRQSAVASKRKADDAARLIESSTPEM